MSYKIVTDLRKEGKITEALQLACEDYKADRNKWSCSALFWVLNTICNNQIQLGDYALAVKTYEQMQEISSDYLNDDEYVAKALRSLQYKVDPNYTYVKEATEKSKAGDHQEAYAMLQSLQRSGALSLKHHEAYGWIIYHYLTRELESLSSLEIRKLLSVYMQLSNNRPSMLHSLYINVAAKVSERHSDFKLLPFIRLWGVKNFALEDYKPTLIKGKEIKPLVERLIVRLGRQHEWMPKEICEVFSDSHWNETKIIELLRESWHYDLYNASKNKEERRWSLYQDYVNHFKGCVPTERHSRILESAFWDMKEENSYRFYTFLKEWGVENFRPADWQAAERDGNQYKSLVENSIRRIFEGVKQTTQKDIDFMVPLLIEAISRDKMEPSLKRHLAQVYAMVGKKEKAIDVYKELLSTFSEWYIWFELGKLLEDSVLRKALLCKTLTLQKQDDFIGDVRLALAETLIATEDKIEAATELNLYFKHRESKGWKVNALYNQLICQVDASKAKPNNKVLYNEQAEKADEFIYSDCATTPMMLVDTIKNKEEKNKLLFVDKSGTIVITIGLERFSKLFKAKKGDWFEFVLIQKEEKRYAPLCVKSALDRCSVSLPWCIGFVEYVNASKQVIHIIDQHSNMFFYPYERSCLKQGDFVRFTYYYREIKGESKVCITSLESCSKEEAISHFKSEYAVVTHINYEKELFNLCIAGGHLSLRVLLKNTDIRPETGDVFKIRYYLRNNKEGIKQPYILDMQPSEDLHTNLVSFDKGFIDITCKNGDTPSFGFINDVYVPGVLIAKKGVNSSNYVEVMLVKENNKWKAINIEILS